MKYKWQLTVLKIFILFIFKNFFTLIYSNIWITLLSLLLRFEILFIGKQTMKALETRLLI